MFDKCQSIWGDKPPMKNRENADTPSIEYKATCSCCGKEYSCNEAERRAVIEGKVEALCPYCDGSHDDHDFPPEPRDDDMNRKGEEYPPEQENRDDDKRHGL